MNAMKQVMEQKKLQRSPGKKNPPLKAINIIDYRPEQDLEVLPMTGDNLQILDKQNRIIANGHDSSLMQVHTPTSTNNSLQTPIKSGMTPGNLPSNLNLGFGDSAS